MTETSERIPFAVEISRMIEVLAAQIYPTPFALLRENVQNSFDAILQRQYLGQDFAAGIDVDLEARQVRVTDNGIGMSREDLRKHFWRAGSSSKNTEDASAAGVVGTFGIGAMANFGIAEEVQVETEDIPAGERTACSAFRSTLSVTEDCISFEPQASTGNPGTKVTAVMQSDKPIQVDQAQAYTRLLHKLWHVVVTQAPAFSDASARRALSMENVSQHTQHGFATIHDRLDGWFNLTGGELNPHADAA